jgi:hypothetical protein
MNSEKRVMKIGRMQTWARLLRRIQREKKPFNMDAWARNDAIDAISGVPVCGTVCCAAGEAALYKPFQDKGLFLVGRDGKLTTVREVHDEIKRHPSDLVEVWCDGHGDGVEAVEHFFGLTFRQVERLVIPSKYRTKHRTQPKHVAERIEQMIAKEREKRAGVTA